MKALSVRKQLIVCIVFILFTGIYSCEQPVEQPAFELQSKPSTRYWWFAYLTPAHYQPYFDRLIKAFPRPQTKIPQAYFIDSWEVETEKLWCDGFDTDFEKRFGYDIKPYMDALYEPANNT